MFEPRDYQETAISAVVRDMEERGQALLVQPTGSGKAYCLAESARRYMQRNRGVRGLIIIDQRNLVEQLSKTFSAVNKGCNWDIVCAGIQKGFNRHAQVLIASRQSLFKRVVEIGRIDFIIADEAHEWSLQAGDEPSGQFATIYQTLRDANPSLILVGCTATPYTLRHGYIYGSRNKPGYKPYFDKVSYQCTYAKLFSEGFLVRPRFFKEVVFSAKGVKIDSTTGDFSKPETSWQLAGYIPTIPKVCASYLSDRKKIGIFCTDIATCDRLTSVMIDAGWNAVSMHSKNKNNQSDLDSFKNGEARVLVTVDQAVKGFDYPPMDGCIMFRPTMSPAICLQIIGRFLRIDPATGKVDCKIVDMVGNLDRHIIGNDLDKVVVAIPSASKKQKEAELNIIDPGKPCKMCHKHSPIQSRVCQHCGAQFGFSGQQSSPERKVQKFAEVQHADSTYLINLQVHGVSSNITSADGRMAVSYSFATEKGIIKLVLHCTNCDSDEMELWGTITRHFVNGKPYVIPCPHSIECSVNHLGVKVKSISFRRGEEQ